MENIPEYPALIIASSLVGVVVVPLNTMLKKADLSYIITQLDSRFIIFNETIKGIPYGQLLKNDLLKNTIGREERTGE
ncbi:AMP-binding protein [Virgibacillus sp. W0430]|uniref:AMP-binding protein n=1 Tax=Virgibacillus sp. W0430 TaxID=3391580 RepID=UPI003F48038C